MMQAPNHFKLSHGVSWMLIWAALDQTSKWAVVHFFALTAYEPHAVLPFLDMTLVWNTGMSYGLLGGTGDAGRWLLSGVAVFAIALFLWFLRHGETRLTGMAYGLLAGGALGNLVDRIWYGAVVDFVSLHWNGYYWYVFNLADVWITLAVALLLLQLYLEHDNPH
jgi:lipoprotein signal peptidase